MMSRKLHCVLTTTCLLLGVSAEWKHLHVKYALWDGFYGLPLTLAQVRKDDPPKYVKMSHDEHLNVDLYSYPNDPRLSLMFDSQGNIAGLRTAYIKEDVGSRARSKNLNFTYSFDDKPMYTSGVYWDIPVWHTSVLFAGPGTLKSGGRKEGNNLAGEEVYLKLDGIWTAIPLNECEAEAIGFTKQACFVGMGMHYFYQVSTSTDCKDYQGAFLLYEKGRLIGLGLNPFGAFTNGQRKWFEDPPPDVVKKIVPNGPECLSEWVTNYGATSIHIFFKRFPRLTVCMWPWQKSDQCKDHNPFQE